MLIDNFDAPLMEALAGLNENDFKSAQTYWDRYVFPRDLFHERSDIYRVIINCSLRFECALMDGNMLARNLEQSSLTVPLKAPVLGFTTSEVTELMGRHKIDK